MSKPDFCTEAEITSLVHRFYARVREDAALGPIFEQFIHDWPAHLAQMVDFWSAMLRGTRRFEGSPMSTHVNMPGLDPALFQQWLHLFHQSTAELENAALSQEANSIADRVASRLWQGYQRHNPHANDTDGLHDTE